MTRQDIYFIVIHLAAFFVAYSASMAALIHGNPAFTGWFDWGCLNQGLIAAGATVLGTSIPGGGPSGNSMSRFLRLHTDVPLVQEESLVKEEPIILSNPAPKEAKFTVSDDLLQTSNESKFRLSDDPYEEWKSYRARWVAENNRK